MDWNDVFKLPEAALAGGKRIPKTVLTAQANLTKHEQKTLDKVKRIEHFATVQKSTTRIPPCVDEERDIQGVIFLTCEMAGGSEAYAEVSGLLHRCFPNPTVVLIDGDTASISVSVTRKSKAEKGAVVIEKIESTDAFRPDDERLRPFLDALALEKLSQRDLLGYLRDIAWSIRLSRSMPTIGFFPSCGEVDRPKLEELIGKSDELGRQVAEIKTQRRDKDLTLNEQAKLGMLEKSIKKERDKVACEIKELCNGRY